MPDYKSDALPTELRQLLNQQLSGNEGSFERLTSQFLQERKYLQNVSPKTLVSYQCAFNAFGSVQTRESIMQRICELRQRMSAISINCYLRHMRAYWKWAGINIKIPKLKEEQKILPTLSADNITAILRFKAIGTNLIRAHMVALVILDTGLRVSECTGLKHEDCDFDNLVLRVHGKGGKQRLVPFSCELRPRLWKWSKGRSIIGPIFGTKNNTKVSVRNLERDFKILGKKLGITGVRFSPHTFRHSMAVNYLRRGGNLEFLRRILGHTSLVTTQKYLKSLGVEDLSAVHSSLSCLTRV